MAIMASNAVIAGPTSQRVAKNVMEWRKARQLQQKDLSAKLREIGRPMLSTVISKIERGERRIDVDDLMALAVALDVSPLALLLPTRGKATDPCALTDSLTAPAADVWLMADGEVPLHLSEDDPAGHLVRYETDSRPPYARTIRLGGSSPRLTKGQREKLRAAGYAVDNEPGDSA